ncbi:MAG: 50S ribosomal protein L24 [Candidatus Woesearchaeota archaeon]|nr:50S ribosomal protein L24 [Candidatus Woesearchaeota archaeon]
MKTKWSKHWKSSKQRRKQRKYVANAPLHIRKKLFSTSLSKELRKKHNLRNIPLVKGDRVKVMRGQFKKHIGKVESKDYKKVRIYIEGINAVKKDGTKKFIPIHPSNVIITELNLDDKRRKKILERKRK